MRHHEEDGEGYDELEDDDDGYDGRENDGIICDDEFVNAMSMGLSITTNNKRKRLFHPSISYHRRRNFSNAMPGV